MSNKAMTFVLPPNSIVQFTCMLVFTFSRSLLIIASGQWTKVTLRNSKVSELVKIVVAKL